jgi:hypothetical protein
LPKATVGTITARFLWRRWLLQDELVRAILAETSALESEIEKLQA